MPASFTRRALVGLLAVACVWQVQRSLPLAAQPAPWRLSARWPLPGASFVAQDYGLLALSFEPGGRLAVFDSAGPELRIFAAPGSGPPATPATATPAQDTPGSSPSPRVTLSPGTPSATMTQPATTTATASPSPSASPRRAPALLLPWLGAR